MIARDIILECGGGWLPRSQAKARAKAKAQKVADDMKRLVQMLTTADQPFMFSETEKRAFGAARVHLAKARWEINKYLSNEQ